MERLFIAVKPPEAVAQKLLLLTRPTASKARWVDPDQWHITLRFLGEADHREVQETLFEWADNWTDSVPRATVGPATAVLGDVVVVAPVAGLDELASSIAAVTSAIGESLETRHFVGHLTLCHFRGDPPEGSVGVPVSTVFDVTEVLLVRSRAHAGEVTHDVLDRFPLMARGLGSSAGVWRET